MCGGTRITPFMKQCFLTLGVNLTMICFGCALAFTNILLPALHSPDSTIDVDMASQSMIVSVFALGMLGGSLLAPPIMGRLGRKVAHCVVSVLFIIGWLAISFANDYRVLVTCRILKGIAGGLLFPLSSVLLAECSSPRNRGAFLATITLSQSIGFFIIYSLGSVLDWKTASRVFLIFPFMSLIMTIFTPESPSWYLSRGKYDKFIEVFRWFRGNVEEEELRSMLGSKLDKDKTEAEDTNGNCFSKMKEVMRMEFYKPLIITIHSTILTLFGGALLMSYSYIIFRNMIGPHFAFYLWIRYTTIASLLLNFIAIFVIHKFDRRFIIFLSVGLCIFSYVGSVFYLYAISAGWLQMTSWIAILFISLLLLSNAIGIVPLRFVIAGEVFPLRYRSIGASISSAFGTMGMILLLPTFHYLLDKIQLQGIYLVNGSIVLYILLILWVMLPETRGRTLFQIEQGFKGKPMQFTQSMENDVVLPEINVK